MLKKVYMCIIMLIAFVTTCVTANAESIFTAEQVRNVDFHSIKANSDTCIAANDYYVSKYENGQWSNAIFNADKNYIITDICVKDDLFYMSEYSETQNKGRLLKSIDGKQWECLTEYNANHYTRFRTDSTGNILIRCADGTVLPEGFARNTGIDSQQTWKYFETEFEGKTIKIRQDLEYGSKGIGTYAVTAEDGVVSAFYIDEYCSDNAIKMNDDFSYTIIMNGEEYKAEEYYTDNYPWILYKRKEDRDYVLKIGNKYYYTYLYSSGRKNGTFISTFEEDEDGNIKRDESGDIIWEQAGYIEQPIVGFKYVDNVFYADFFYETESGEQSEQWHCSTDLENWTECDEPLSLDNVAESIGGEDKICLGGTVRNVAYENNELTNPMRGYNVRYEDAHPNLVGEYYYSLDDEYFRLSKDGVYYAEYELPDGFRPFDRVVITEDGDDFVIQSGIYQIRAPKADVYEKLEEESEEPIYVTYDNEILAFEEQPVISDDRTLIPLRFLFEQMGAEVTWNQEEQTATITQDNTAITVGIDDTEAEVNGQTVSMDVPAQLINDKTMVPVRFLSEQLGYDVSWDGENRIITIE